MNRRHFIRHAAAGAGAWLVLPALAGAAGSYRRPIGFQTYPLRNQMGGDFAALMKSMAGMGYQYTEMCYPAGYDEFRPLTAVKPETLRQIIQDSGLQCPSCHIGMGDLKNNFKACMDFAHGLGLTQIVTPGLDTPGKSIADFKEAAAELNGIAAKIKAEGMATGLHNHTGEFRMLDGQLVYDAIMGALDPSLVKMQFQTEVIKLGYNGPKYFQKYPGRFISAHLSDWTADGKEVPIGQGVINWKEFFAAARTGGVRNFFVEMEPDKFPDSAKYLHQLLG